MRILTVRQPFAHAIIFAGKDVENRSRNIAGSYRGPVLIHAGLRDDDDGYYDPNVDFALDAAVTPSASLARGAIIGVVDLVDAHNADECVVWQGHVNAGGDWQPCSQWAERVGWHLVLANPRRLAEPIPYRGALGLRTLDDETTARIKSAIA